MISSSAPTIDSTASARSTVRNIRTRAINADLTELIATASGVLSSSPLVLIDVLTSDGVTGSAYVFAYTPDALKPIWHALTEMAKDIIGCPLSPVDIDRRLRSRYRLLGVQGVMTMAIAGLDMALWDARARTAGLPLATLLGGEPRPIPAYASYGLLPPSRAGEWGERAARQGFKAVKIKTGYDDLATDVQVIRELRAAAGSEMGIMVDYNQSLSVPEAIRRARTLDSEGLIWIEEPTVAEDFSGHARVAGSAATPIQLGENWWGIADMAKSLAAGASDLAMVDVMKIGGVTGWMKAAALAEVGSLPVSSHLFIEFSGPLLAVTPTAQWLEYLDIAGTVLNCPGRLIDGCLHPSAGLGAGIEWDEGAVARFML